MAQVRRAPSSDHIVVVAALPRQGLAATATTSASGGELVAHASEQLPGGWTVSSALAVVAVVAVVLLNIYLMMHSIKVAGSISQDPKFVVGTEEDLEEQHKQVLSKHMAMNLFT